MPAKQPEVGTGAGNYPGASSSLSAGSGKNRGRVKGKGKGAMRGMVEVEVGEVEEDGEELRKITITRTGVAYHGSCLPP